MKGVVDKSDEALHGKGMAARYATTGYHFTNAERLLAELPLIVLKKTSEGAKRAESLLGRISIV